MTVYFASCRPDGAVCGCGEVPDDAAFMRQQATDEDGMIARVDQETHDAIKATPNAHYLSGGVVLPREPMPVTLNKRYILADGVEEAVVEGFPPGARLMVAGTIVKQPYQPIGPEPLVITSTERGRLILTVDCPPRYIPWKAIIDAS